MHKCEWSYLAKVDAATWAFKSAILVEANKRRLGHIPFSRLLINGGYLQNNLCSAIPHRVEQWRCGFGGCPRRHWRKADSTLHEINVRNWCSKLKREILMRNWPMTAPSVPGTSDNTLLQLYKQLIWILAFACHLTCTQPWEAFYPTKDPEATCLALVLLQSKGTNQMCYKNVSWKLIHMFLWNIDLNIALLSASHIHLAGVPVHKRN